MSIDAAQVKQIAYLARIGLAEGEAEGYIGELESILEMVGRMEAVNTEGVEPLAHPLEVSQRLRADTVTETDQRERLQAGAPAVEDGFFVVPRVVE